MGGHKASVEKVTNKQQPVAVVSDCACFHICVWKENSSQSQHDSTEVNSFYCGGLSYTTLHMILITAASM